MTKNSKKNTILIILSVALALAAVMVAAALFVSVRNDKEALNDALDASELELVIRSLPGDERAKREQKELSEHEAALSERKALTEQMFERDKEDLLTVVNPWTPLDEEYNPRLVYIGNDLYIDERCAIPLLRMLSDCKDEGIQPVVISAYRTWEYQQMLFDDKVQRVIYNGFSAENAPDEAAKSVARPGTSEHQLGLAVDIIDNDNPNLDLTQEWTSTQIWLMEHCTDYGFILRYPNETTEETGIVYEPWHYRYVGIENAKAMQPYINLTLERYLTGDYEQNS